MLPCLPGLQLASFHKEESLKALIDCYHRFPNVRRYSIFAQTNPSLCFTIGLVLCVSSSFLYSGLRRTNAALWHPDRNINDDKRLGDILNTIIDIFKEASDLIPVPYVKPVVMIHTCSDVHQGDRKSVV